VLELNPTRDMSAVTMLFIAVLNYQQHDWLCAGQEESRQRSSARKTQEQSAQVSEEAPRKSGKNEETLKNMLFVY